jgi:hypothetical protein
MAVEESEKIVKDFGMQRDLNLAVAAAGDAGEPDT